MKVGYDKAMPNQRVPDRYGFTIVELLIVIVVIAILATISVVAYNGIQNRANDTAVQSDLKNIAKKFELYKVEKDVYPVGSSQIGPLGIRVSKSAYGNGFINGGNAFNLLYCRLAAEGPTRFALMASSKAGNTVFVYGSDTGVITTLTSWPAGSSVDNCKAVGINQVSNTDRDIFFVNNAWDSAFVGS